MENTLVILKPCAIERGLIGEVIARFEKKGLVLSGMKMVWLTDEILSEHYSHQKDKPFFEQLKKSMRTCPVVVCCWTGVDAVRVVRMLVGSTNGRDAQPGTIRGDYSMSIQQNVIHASDSLETARIELRRFFDPQELYSYSPDILSNIYTSDEV